MVKTEMEANSAPQGRQGSESAKKAKLPRKPHVNWEKDGVNGGNSSMKVLLDWLTRGNNYIRNLAAFFDILQLMVLFSMPNFIIYYRWRGDAGGVTKESLCVTILNEMRDQGIMWRTSADIRTHISTLQTQYNKAIDWRGKTGQGLLDAGTETADSIHGMFQWCIFGQRPSLG